MEWTEILMSIITTVITFGSVYVRKWFKSRSTESEMRADMTLQEKRAFVIDNRLLPALYEMTEHWLLTKLPVLLKDVKDGDGFDWGVHIKDLREYLKKGIVEKFLAENTDILAEYGADQVNDWIDRTIAKVSTRLPQNMQRYAPIAAGVIDIDDSDMKKLGAVAGSLLGKLG